MPTKLSRDAYTVGWIALNADEITAARLVFQSEHESLPRLPMDDNVYILGDVEGHNVVVAFPGMGQMGTAVASHVTTNMMRTFVNIDFVLVVGAASGAPGPSDPSDPLKDLRLGDVVVGFPAKDGLSALQIDRGRWSGPSEFKIESLLPNPPKRLLSAVTTLSSDHRFGNDQMMEFIQASASATAHSFLGWDKDQLFKASYNHVQGGDDCSACDQRELQVRLPRESHRPAVHIGKVASSNSVIMSAEYRDKMRADHEILCFETGAAGVMACAPCLVIKGISDYGDSHVNNKWQPYAATTAASYARALLRVLA
ncbi:purine and uridine phosphorylase [Cladorrhinum sp. PSN259]|nr:purine and uridine phosphorylase [Cladorrhinum sp. PSN259]